MPLFGNKPTPPTLEERAVAAAVAAAEALSIFELAAQDLEHAAIEAEDVAEQARAEADRLAHVADGNRKAAVRRREQAGQVRALVGPTE